MPAPTDHVARRRRIAEAVWLTIAEHGIEGATMRKVAAAGGISVGQVQHYFAGRDELLRYSCQAMVDLAAEAPAVAGGLAQRPLESLRELLALALDQSTAYRLGARVWAAFVAHAVVDEVVGRVVVEAQRGLEQEVARLLRAADRDESEARGLVALGEGLAQRTLTAALTTDEAVAVLDRALARLPAPGPAA